MTTLHIIQREQENERIARGLEFGDVRPAGRLVSVDNYGVYLEVHQCRTSSTCANLWFASLHSDAQTTVIDNVLGAFSVPPHRKTLPVIG
jgi:hypothetical protein